MSRIQEMTARVKLEVDPAATRELEKTAKATRAVADEETRLAKTITETGKARIAAAQAAEKAGGLPGQKLAGTGVIGASRQPGPMPAPAPTPAASKPFDAAAEAQRRYDRRQQEEAVKRELDKLEPKPGIGGQLGMMLQNNILGRFGMGGIMAGGAGTVATGAGAALAALAGSVRMGHQEIDIQANPFTSGGQKQMQRRYMMPGWGWLQRQEDAFRRSEMWSNTNAGRQEEAFQRATARGTAEQATFGVRQQISALPFTVGTEQQLARNRADLFSDFTTPGRREGYDRQSPAERIRYLEETQILPARAALAKSAKELAVSEAKLTTISSNRTKLDEQAAKLKSQALDAETRRVRLDANPTAINYKTDQEKIAVEMAEIRRQQEANDALRQANAQQMTEARGEVAGRRSDVRQARIAKMETELGQLQEREAKAREGSAGLAAMGVAGRMQGRLALQMLQQIGVEAAPPELQQQAAAIAPETVRDMQERAGQSFVAEFRDIAPGESRYRDDLESIQGQVNRKEFELRKARDTDVTSTAEEMGDVLEGLVNRMVDVFKARVESIERGISEDRFREANNALP